MDPTPPDLTSNYKSAWTGTTPRRFAMKVQQQTKEIFVGVVAAADKSIVTGSRETGAPGQPVDTGALRASWQTIFDSPTSALIATNIEYAPYVEAGINRWGPVQYKKGGPHNVKLTIAAIDRLVAQEVVRVTEGRGGGSAFDRLIAREVGSEDDDEPAEEA